MRVSDRWHFKSERNIKHHVVGNELKHNVLFLYIFIRMGRKYDLILLISQGTRLVSIGV